MTDVIVQEFIDEARVAHRRECAYLKGFVVGYAVKRGMKWDGDPDRTPEFRQRFDEGQGRYGSESATYVHCLYNNVRHNRPHLGSAEKDSLLLASYCGVVRGRIEKALLFGDET